MTKSSHFNRGRSVKSTGMASIVDSTWTRGTDHHLLGTAAGSSVQDPLGAMSSSFAGHSMKGRT